MPTIEVLQVLASGLGALLCWGELLDANRDVYRSRSDDDEPMLCFAAVAHRREEALLISVHLIFGLTGLYVIVWRTILHPDVIAMTVTMTRDASILWSTCLLTSISLWHRFNRRTIRAMVNARQARQDEARQADLALRAHEAELLSSAAVAAAEKIASVSETQAEVFTDQLNELHDLAIGHAGQLTGLAAIVARNVSRINQLDYMATKIDALVGKVDQKLSVQGVVSASAQAAQDTQLTDIQHTADRVEVTVVKVDRKIAEPEQPA